MQLFLSVRAVAMEVKRGEHQECKQCHNTYRDQQLAQGDCHKHSLEGDSNAILQPREAARNGISLSPTSWPG